MCGVLHGHAEQLREVLMCASRCVWRWGHEPDVHKPLVTRTRSAHVRKPAVYGYDDTKQMVGCTWFQRVQGHRAGGIGQECWWSPKSAFLRCWHCCVERTATKVHYEAKVVVQTLTVQATANKQHRLTDIQCAGHGALIPSMATWPKAGCVLFAPSGNRTKRSQHSSYGTCMIAKLASEFPSNSLRAHTNALISCTCILCLGSKEEGDLGVEQGGEGEVLQRKNTGDIVSTCHNRGTQTHTYTHLRMASRLRKSPAAPLIKTPKAIHWHHGIRCKVSRTPPSLEHTRLMSVTITRSRMEQ
eukprot:1142708-Pelagomonas_calceolata.AAC.3